MENETELGSNIFLPCGYCLSWHFHTWASSVSMNSHNNQCPSPPGAGTALHQHEGAPGAGGCTLLLPLQGWKPSGVQCPPTQLPPQNVSCEAWGRLECFTEEEVPCFQQTDFQNCPRHCDQTLSGEQAGAQKVLLVFLPTWLGAAGSRAQRGDRTGKPDPSAWSLHSQLQGLLPVWLRDGLNRMCCCPWPYPRPGHPTAPGLAPHAETLPWALHGKLCEAKGIHGLNTEIFCSQNWRRFFRTALLCL